MNSFAIFSMLIWVCTLWPGRGRLVIQAENKFSKSCRKSRWNENVEL